VLEVREPGIDVDAAGFVSAAVRRAVSRGQGLQLAGSKAHGELAVEIVDMQIGLGTFSEPGLRAARYQVWISLRGKLTDASGFAWTSAPITGYAPFFSTPGPIEALDGAGRRALEHATQEAAERLIASLMLVLNREITRSRRSESAADRDPAE
jgi:hypothetical protein